MKPIPTRRHRTRYPLTLPGLALTVFVSVSSAPSSVTAAETLANVDGTVFNLRTFDGPNNVGVNPGDRILTGAFFSPVSGTSVTMSQVSATGAINPSTGTTTFGPYVLPPLNSPAIPYEFSVTYDYGPAAGSGLLGAWNIQAANASTSNPLVEVQTPSIANATLMPLATDLRMTMNGGVSVVNWNNPNSASWIDIHIHDLSVPREYFGLPPSQYVGFAPIVHEESSRLPNVDTRLPGNATSFTIPTQFSSGLELDVTHQYALSVIRYQTEQQTVNGVERDWVVSRSRTFVSFNAAGFAGFPVPPETVYLPTVTSAPDLTATEFSFHIGSVGTDLIYLDPAVAIGYEYVAGAGDPAFRSVRLPDIGDGQFIIQSFDENTGQWVDLMAAVAGNEILFGPSGLRRFRVMGIEADANLDPNDPTAFVTGVSFVTSGQFTGRMIAVVPEPSTWALLLLGAGLIAPRLDVRSRTTRRSRGA